MFMSQSVRKRRKSLILSASGFKCLNREYLDMLTWILEFQDYYFSYNMVSECKLMTTSGAQPKKQQSVSSPRWSLMLGFSKYF